MGAQLNLMGKRFGRLTAIEMVRKPGDASLYWACLCDCGGAKTARASRLLKGVTNSCGCYQKAMTSKANKTHGLSNNPTYHAWKNMKARCSKTALAGYANYGARGIKVCERWEGSFDLFRQDMGECPPGLSIERRDVNGDYEPSNCCWASTVEQANNTRRNRWIEHAGERKTMAQWAAVLGKTPQYLRYRLEKGLTLEQIRAALG